MHRESEIKDCSGKPIRALDVFSLAMKCMINDFLENMNKSINITCNDIDFVLTVPAIWGDIGKMFMQEAAVQVSCKLVLTNLDLNPEI